MVPFQFSPLISNVCCRAQKERASTERDKKKKLGYGAYTAPKKPPARYLTAHQASQVTHICRNACCAAAQAVRRWARAHTRKKKKNRTFRVASLVHTAHSSGPSAITNTPDALCSVSLWDLLGYSSGNCSLLSVGDDKKSHSRRHCRLAFFRLCRPLFFSARDHRHDHQACSEEGPERSLAGACL